MTAPQLIDHTLLRPDATKDEIRKLAMEAQQHQFHSVCVNPCWVPEVARILSGSEVAVCSVVAFPLGATSPAAKAFEARHAVEDGADEVDMVMNIGDALEGDWDLVQADIRSVVEAVRPETVVKVILETCLLDDQQITRACEVAVRAGADFVKTSTGFSTGGATVHAVQIMRATVGPNFGVKASGGIHTPDQADAMVEAGATRIGASAGAALLTKVG